MNKNNFLKYVVLGSLFLILSANQNVSAQETPAAAPAELSANVEHNAKSEALKQPLIKPKAEQEREAKTLNTVMQLNNKLNLRNLKNIKWPKIEDEGNYPKGGSLEEKKNFLDKTCRNMATRYQADIYKNYGIRKGELNIEYNCDVLTELIKDSKELDNDALEIIVSQTLKKIDMAFFNYYNSQAYLNSRAFHKSPLGMVGLPIEYHAFLIQILVLLSLGLNVFLFIKTR